MIFTYFLNFDAENLFFNQTFTLQQNIFSLHSTSSLFYLYDFSVFNFTYFFFNLKNSSLIVDFINQTDDLHLFDNLENVKTIYHYSIPNTKLAYPEPFIASASMMHSDL